MQKTQKSEKDIMFFITIDKKDARLMKNLQRKCKKRKTVKKTIMFYMKNCK